MISKSFLSGIAGLGTVGTGGYAVVHFGLLDSYIPAIPSWKLGLPSGCVIPTEDDKEVSCEISKQEELTGIQFKETAGKGNLTVTGLDDSKKITLKIKRLSKEEKEKEFVGDSDVRFTFSAETEDVVIKSGDSALLTIKKGTNPEFKVNKNKLERTWTAETLIKKIGDFTCTNGENAKCTFNSESQNKKINIKNESDIKEGTIESGKLSDGFTYTEGVQDYNQGFKFSYGGSQEADLGNDVKIAVGACYEVKYEAGEGKGWHLSKKNT